MKGNTISRLLALFCLAFCFSTAALAHEDQTPPPPPVTHDTNTNTNTNANSSTSTSSPVTNATGGDVKNSGNSSNKNDNLNLSSNKNSNKQGQAQGQGQQQSATASDNGNGNVNGSNNTEIVTHVEAPKIPVATAYAPAAIPTVPCALGYSGGGQGLLAGATGAFTRVDKTCQQLETARNFGISGSRKAYCKVMVSTKWAKKAGVTFDDCMYQDPAPVAATAIPAAPTPAPVQATVEVNPRPLQ